MGEQLVGTFIMRFRLQRLKLSKHPVSVTGRRAYLQKSWGTVSPSSPPLAPAALLSLHM